jgi:protein TonB
MAALGLSLAIHGAAAAAFLIAAEDDLPVPGGAISVELVAALPGGSAGAHAAADKPAPAPEETATEAAREPAVPEKPEPEPVEPAKTEAVPEPVEKDAPILPAADAPAETVVRPKPPAQPEAARKLEEAARPKLADKPPAKPAPARKAAPDTARDSGTAGPSGAAADTPEVAAIERTAPGFAVGSGANPLPDYPYRARRLGQQGRVVLRVAVSPNGMPVEVEVARSSGHDNLDDAALDTVRQWRFTPAQIGGVAVAGTVEVPITFRLLGENAR